MTGAVIMSLSDRDVEDMMITARELGATAGTSASSWVFDGNTDQAAYERCVKLDDAGDPAWWDDYGPTSGPLSGEWAESPTPQGLAVEVDLAPADDVSGDVLIEVGDAFVEAFHDAWRDEVMRVARYHLG